MVSICGTASLLFCVVLTIAVLRPSSPLVHTHQTASVWRRLAHQSLRSRILRHFVGRLTILRKACVRPVHCLTSTVGDIGDPAAPAVPCEADDRQVLPPSFATRGLGRDKKLFLLLPGVGVPASGGLVRVRQKCALRVGAPSQAQAFSRRLAVSVARIEDADELTARNPSRRCEQVPSRRYVQLLGR